MNSQLFYKSKLFVVVQRSMKLPFFHLLYLSEKFWMPSDIFVLKPQLYKTFQSLIGCVVVSLLLFENICMCKLFIKNKVSFLWKVKKKGLKNLFSSIPNLLRIKKNRFLENKKKSIWLILYIIYIQVLQNLQGSCYQLPCKGRISDYSIKYQTNSDNNKKWCWKKKEKKTKIQSNLKYFVSFPKFNLIILKPTNFKERKSDKV